jgi:hypothetical protein
MRLDEKTVQANLTHVLIYVSNGKYEGMKRTVMCKALLSAKTA